MQNPNAVTALVSSQAAVALEQLGEKYLDVRVGTFWSKEIMAVLIVCVLYIGRDGLKAALGKVVSTAKSIWAPQPEKP
jgi:hypothetical protein